MSIVGIYQKALEMLRQESHLKIQKIIKRDNQIAGAMFSSFSFRVTAEKKVTQEDLETHLSSFDIEWKELQPYLDKAEVYWKKLGEDRKKMKRKRS